MHLAQNQACEKILTYPFRCFRWRNHGTDQEFRGVRVNSTKQQLNSLFAFAAPFPYSKMTSRNGAPPVVP